MDPDLEKELQLDPKSFSDHASYDLVSAQAERARWTPLTRMLMSGEMSGEAPRDLTWREKLDRWWVDTAQMYRV